MFLWFENTLSRHGHLTRVLMAALALCFSVETFGLCFHDHSHEAGQSAANQSMCPCSLHAHTDDSCDHCPDHRAMCGDGSHHHGRFHFERPAPVVARVTDDSAPEDPGALFKDSSILYATAFGLVPGHTAASGITVARCGPPCSRSDAGVCLPLLI